MKARKNRVKKQEANTRRGGGGGRGQRVEHEAFQLGVADRGRTAV